MKHIPSPCYDGLWCHFKGSTPTYNKFWFCVDDMTHCVGGTRKTYIIDRSIVSTIWLVQVRNKLTCDEVTLLEEVEFVLCEEWKCAP